MAERSYYSYTIPLDENGQPLIIHRSDAYIICHAIDKEGKGIVLKIATDTYFTNKEAMAEAYERAKLALDFSQRVDCDSCCKYYEVGFNNEDFYIAMQYIKGIPLSSILSDIDIVTNSNDLDILEQQLISATTALSNAGIRQNRLYAENILLSEEMDGVVLLNYTALADEGVENEQSAKDFVDQIRRVKTEEQNKRIATQLHLQRQRRRRKRIWLLSGILCALFLMVFYLFAATSIPKEIEARWKYETIESHGKLFKVKLGQKYGVLSSAYEEIVPVEYEKVQIDTRHPSSFIVYKQGLSGVYHIDRRTETIALQYDSVTWVGESVYRVYQNGNSLLANAIQARYLYSPTDYRLYKSNHLYGYRDVFGNVLIQPQFDHAEPFLRTTFLAAASKNGKWGVINADGLFVVSPLYEQVRPCQEVSAVKKEGYWGYVLNLKNEPIGEFIYSKVEDWGREVADVGRVYQMDKSMLLGRDGNYRYRDEDMIIYLCEGTYYVMDQFGTVLFVTSGIDKMYNYKCGRARVRKDGILVDDYGYIDYKGNVVIPIQYSEASDFEDGRAIVAKGNLLRDRMVININGYVIEEL